MSNLTLEQLAEQMNKTVWQKGDLKRIYLNDAGHNTKKMSTKAFIWQDEKGNFMVSCRIECPSQPYEWIRSQEDKVKESTYAWIEELLATQVYLIVNESGQALNADGSATEINDLSDLDVFYTEEAALEAIDEIYQNDGLSVKTMPKDEFTAEVERLDEIERNMPLVDKIQRGDEIYFHNGPDMDTRVEEISAAGLIDQVTVTIQSDGSGRFKISKEGDRPSMEIIAEHRENQNQIVAEKAEIKGSVVIGTIGVGTEVKHDRFGMGKVIAESGTRVEIAFEDAQIGIKNLLKQFAKLEIIE